MTCVIACSKLWRPDIASRVEGQTREPCVLLTNPDQLSEERLAQINLRLPEMAQALARLCGSFACVHAAEAFMLGWKINRWEK